MQATDAVNTLGLVGALALGVTLATTVIPRSPDGPGLKLVETAAVTTEEVNGVTGLRDASGRFVPLGDYQRIVSLSSVTDGLVHALVSQGRIAAYSPYAKHSHHAYRFSDRPHLELAYNVESLLSMSPDLVLANHLSRPDQVAQLRAAGLFVFDLGEMKGMKTLLPNIRSTATLLKVAERGYALATRVQLRMQRLAAHVQQADRPGAIYAGIHGDKIYGGARNTSYHDVLEAAGLSDLAAPSYEGWPRYTSEQLLQLDPPVLVTQQDMSDTLCRHPGLSAMKACGHGGRMVEIPSALLLSPGLDMLEAAEELHLRVHGRAVP